MRYLDNIIKTYQPRAELRGVAMRTEFQNDLPIWVQTDSNLLSKIVTELVDNAVKFTEEGFIDIGVEQAEEEQVMIFIKDSGTGVHPEFLESVWDAFVQESDGLTRSHEGLGIGLTLAKEFAELLGGSLELQSEVGVGTTARLVIPFGTSNTVSHYGEASGLSQKTDA